MLTHSVTVAVTLAFLAAARQSIMWWHESKIHFPAVKRRFGTDMLIVLWVGYLWLLALMLMAPGEPVTTLSMAAIIVFVSAAGLRLWAFSTLGRFYSAAVVVYEGHAIVRSGPYRVLAHPLYLGLTLEVVAIAVSTASWLGYLVAIVVIGAIRVQIRREEMALTEAFGEAYSEYRMRAWDISDGWWNVEPLGDRNFIRSHGPAQGGDAI